MLNFTEKGNNNHSSPMLHGNLYKMKEGLFKAELYNQLPNGDIRLNGHYTILFSVPDFMIYCFQHGDWGNLVSYIPLDYRGFLELTETEKEYLKELAMCTMENKRIVNYDYELFGTPEYMKQFN